ncbi:MAG: hypothetical protein HFG05_00115 [Oscillibacter sp.]|nr:hypothetical protein [Oscillibacter sp.]
MKRKTVTRFMKTYTACLFLLGLLLVVSMGWPAGMVLLFIFQRYPLLSWMLAAFVLAIPVSAWIAWKERRGRDSETWEKL